MDEAFRKRLEKTLYCGELEVEDAPFALTDLSVEYFQGLTPHNLSYIDLHSASTITSHDTVSTSSMAMGMIYAKRLQKKRPDYVRKMSSSDLFLISMMMASKYLYDEGVDEEVFNDEWAENADLEKEEVNSMERDFLDAMDWELFVKKDEFDNTMLSIERSIALREGLKRGWFSYTDLCLLWDDPRLEWWISNIGIEWLRVAAVSSAAYFAAALTMVGSTVLVTSAPMMLASSGVLPILMTGLQSTTLPQELGPLPAFHNLPHLPALQFPADSAPSFHRHNETQAVEEEKQKQEGKEQEPGGLVAGMFQEPGKTVVETIMSQLMAVLTLKSHLVQFVSAVADNYTATKPRCTTSSPKPHEPHHPPCLPDPGADSPTPQPEAADLICSRWQEMEESLSMLAHSGLDESLSCSCGNKMSHSNHHGHKSLKSSVSSMSRKCLPENSEGAHLAADLNRRFTASCGLQKGCRMLGCHQEVLDMGHSFPDITIGFATSTPLPVYAT